MRSFFLLCRVSSLRIFDMQRILDLDTQLTQMFAGLENVAHSLSFEPLGNLLEVDHEAIRFPGLYLIEIRVDPEPQPDIKSWMTDFKAAWDREEFKKSFVPSCQKARMKRHLKLQEWMPVYLGKSKKVGHRVWEHLHLEAEKSTFALKLKARDLLGSNQLRLSVLRLPVVNYDVLAPKLEAAMRRKFHPLVGRQ